LIFQKAHDWWISYAENGIELIINNLNYDFFNILLNGNYDQKQFEIINHCFKLSLINFSINNFQDYIQIDWPRDKDFKDTYFTYHSTLRVRELSKKYNVFPKIDWRVLLRNHL
jgi:hypothetical protein